MPRYVDLTPPILAHAAPAWAPGTITESTIYERAHFASPADLARAVANKPAWHAARRNSDVDAIYRGYPGSFYGPSPFTGREETPDMAGAVRLLTEGWAEGARVAADAARMLDGALAHTPRVMKRGIAGARPVVALAVAGDPRHMLTRAPMPRGARTVDLTIATICPANLPAAYLTTTAIIAAAVAQRLEDAHYRVGLNAAWVNASDMRGPAPSAFEALVQIKAPHEAVDVGTIAVSAGHPWVSRYVLFCAATHAENFIREAGVGLGFTQPAMRPRSAASPDTAVTLPKPADYAQALTADRLKPDLSPRSLARCLALAVNSLNAQGEGDPLAPRLDPVAWQDVAA